VAAAITGQRVRQVVLVAEGHKVQQAPPLVELAPVAKEMPAVATAVLLDHHIRLAAVAAQVQ
jgi:hypothetical protein